MRRAASGDGDLHRVGDERAGDGESDAARSTRYERDLSFESLHRRLSAVSFQLSAFSSEIVS
jgi:hypothetical protein